MSSQAGAEGDVVADRAATVESEKRGEESGMFRRSWSSWVTFPREEDNPATWIADEFDGEWRPRCAFSLPPYYRDPDPEAPQYLDDMADFYLEAARRLPVAQMPQLAGVLSRGGLLLGLNDPVTNIILSAMYMMDKSSSDYGALPRGADPVRHAADRASYVAVARSSRAALVKFMVFYFRYLTEAQAKRYLRAARHDLALAIGLVEWHRNGKGRSFGLELSPDCGRTKTALWHAAKAAMLLPDPDDLVRSQASRYPRHLLDPVLDDLRRGEQLSVGRVNDILNLLGHPWSPPPPVPAPTPGTFRDADGNVTIIAIIGQDLFSTTTITTDRVAAFRNGANDVVTTTTISRHQSHPDDDAAATGYLSSRSDTESRLRSFLGTTTALQLQPDTKSLKMCLLDTIHGLYIQALAMLPSDHQARLLRAVLAGGHCYGVMDYPVSNIVVNSIWYNARFPHPDDDDYDSLIKATRSMTRAESSSLHGLIAVLRADRGVTEQEAVARLCSNRRNRSRLTMTKSLNHHSLAAAAEAAKHPQPAALVEFLTTSLTFPKRYRLRSLLAARRALSEADFKELKTLIAGDDVAAAPEQRIATTPAPGQSAFNAVPEVPFSTPSTLPFGRPFGTPFGTPSTLPFGTPFGTQSSTLPFGTPSTGFGTPGQWTFNSNTSIFNTMPAAAPFQPTAPDRRRQPYVRTKVEELLLEYGRRNPLGPQYKLSVICGMAKEEPESGACSGCYRHTACYHVNFLASTPADDATTTPPECKLFFAEFWDEADGHFESSKKPPVCCPIQDYHGFPGRCFVCEVGSVRILHPPCGGYNIGRDWYPTDELCAAAERHADLGDQLPVASSRDGGSFANCC